MTAIVSSLAERRVFEGLGVEVWAFDLDRSAEEIDAWWRLLDDDERRQAARLGSAQLWERFIVRRGVRRRLLGERLGVAPESLVFERGPFGKPFLPKYGLGFSASSSEGKGLLAISDDHEVGVDLERIRPDFEFEGLLRMHFTPEEQEAMRGASAEAFFRAWTRKEAAAKASGAGLRATGSELDSAKIWDLELGAGWAAAVAVRQS